MVLSFDFHFAEEGSSPNFSHPGVKTCTSNCVWKGDANEVISFKTAKRMFFHGGRGNPEGDIEGLGEIGLEEVLYLAAGCFEVSVLGFFFNRFCL